VLRRPLYRPHQAPPAAWPGDSPVVKQALALLLGLAGMAAGAIEPDRAWVERSVEAIEHPERFVDAETRAAMAAAQAASEQHRQHAEEVLRSAQAIAGDAMKRPG